VGAICRVLSTAIFAKSWLSRLSHIGKLISGTHHRFDSGGPDDCFANSRDV
jgi:hypothetical protein